MPEMQVPDGLMFILIWLGVIYSVQAAISMAYLVLEIVRDGRDHLEADQAESLPDDTEWETRA